MTACCDRPAGSSEREILLRLLRRGLAQRVGQDQPGGHARRPPPPLILALDPARTPDVDALLAALPRGMGVLYRHFGRPDWLMAAARRARTARKRGLVFEISWPAPVEALALAAGAHLPRAALARRSAWPRLKPGQILSAAAANRPGRGMCDRLFDYVLVSPVFASQSPSARGKPALGVLRLARLCRRMETAVVALGGLDARWAARVVGTGARAVAAVEGFERAFRAPR